MSVLSVMSTRAYSSETIYNYFDIFFFGLFYHALERRLSPKHFTGVFSASDSKCWSIFFAHHTIGFVVNIFCCPFNRTVISFKYSHKIKHRNSSFFIAGQRLFDVFKCSPCLETLSLVVNFGVLIVYLHFMEGLVLNPFCLDYVPSLCYNLVKIVRIFIEFIFLISHWGWSLKRESMHDRRFS